MPKPSRDGHNTLDQLKPDKRNVRKHSEKNLAVLDRSLAEVGAARSIVIDEKNNILAGNGLVAAAKKRGLRRIKIVDADGDTVVAVRRSGLTAKQKTRLAFLDNYSSDTSAFDYDAALLAEIASDDELIRALANEDRQLAALLRSANPQEETADVGELESKADALQKKYDTRLGQIWILGEHRLAIGDCTDKAVVDAAMQGEMAQASVTDFPYGIGVDYGEFKDTPENVRKLINDVIPILLNHSPVAITPGIPLMWDYPRPTWVGAWIHPAPSGGCPWGFVGNNPILFYGADPYLKRGKGRRPDSVVMASDRQGIEGHPTPKPLKVWEWLVERMSVDIGDIIFDPFVGSGTTLIACENLKRKCRAIEISPAYSAVALERWSLLTGREPHLA